MLISVISTLTFESKLATKIGDNRFHSRDCQFEADFITTDVQNAFQSFGDSRTSGKFMLILVRNRILELNGTGKQ